MGIRVKKASDISINVSFPENSWHEISEAIVIFGKQILIVYNSSYRPGFGDRTEDTQVLCIDKVSCLNPCVLCDDVYNALSGLTGEDSGQILETIRAKIIEMNIQA